MTNNLYSIGVESVRNKFVEMLRTVAKQYVSETNDRGIDGNKPSTSEAEWLIQRYSELHKGILFDMLDKVISIPDADALTKLRLIAEFADTIATGIDHVSNQWNMGPKLHIVEP